VRTRLAVAVGASLALHAASALVARRRSAPQAGTPPSQAVTIEFQPQLEEPLATPSARAPATRRAARSEPVAWTAPPEPFAPPDGVEAGGDERPAPPVPPAAVDLSPLAAARTLVDVRSAPDASCAVAEPDAGLVAADDEEVEQALAEHIAGLSRSHEEPAGQRAARTVDRILQPWSQRLPAGRYRYHGRGFEAVILEDGSIAMRDKGAASLMTGIPYTKLDGEPTIALGSGLALPRIDRLFRGNAADAAERREFLARTRALRELLHEKAQARSRARADGELSRVLARLWDGTVPLATRKAKLFVLWDDCADDEIGDERRAQIELFVRERCPPGTTCAFTGGELALLNRTRLSRRPFAPYDVATSVDAGPL
jgi:hypothetical protein